MSSSRAAIRRAVLAALAAAPFGKVLALYDPRPNPALALAPGAWRGSLTYRDWSNPDRIVTLPCTLAVALTAPDELALSFVFNDGPGKTVYSYDRMSFDFAGERMVWTSGTTKPTSTPYRLSSVRSGDDDARLVFERAVDARLDRCTLDVGRRTWSLIKVEVAPSGAEAFRNKYELVRSEA